jgi:hypothetical protein
VLPADMLPSTLLKVHERLCDPAPFGREINHRLPSGSVSSYARNLQLSADFITRWRLTVACSASIALWYISDLGQRWVGTEWQNLSLDVTAAFATECPKLGMRALLH